jgi:hypothetical protein
MSHPLGLMIDGEPWISSFLKRSISADTALRLSRFFGTSAEFWLNLQSQYDLDLQSDRLGTRLDAEVVQFGPRRDSVAPASLESSIRDRAKQRVSARGRSKH